MARTAKTPEIPSLGPLDRAAGQLSRQLAQRLREAIGRGELHAGEALPATRPLAAALGVARGTVTEAFEQLIAEGFLVARGRTGTWVAAAVTPAGSAAPAGRRAPACGRPGGAARGRWRAAGSCRRAGGGGRRPGFAVGVSRAAFAGWAACARRAGEARAPARAGRRVRGDRRRFRAAAAGAVCGLGAGRPDAARRRLAAARQPPARARRRGAVRLWRSARGGRAARGDRRLRAPLALGALRRRAGDRDERHPAGAVSRESGAARRWRLRLGGEPRLSRHHGDPGEHRPARRAGARAGGRRGARRRGRPAPRPPCARPSSRLRTNIRSACR
nr:winged helix-turn-helix domain-containing protein [Burkholderia glumae]